MPTSQGVHSLGFYDTMNTKRSSSSACDIFPKSCPFLLSEIHGGTEKVECAQNHGHEHKLLSSDRLLICFNIRR